jgi:predicted secreted protein
MTVGVGFLGRAVDITLGGATLAGVVSKSLTINNTFVDTTDDNSNGWAESLAEPGRKEVTLGISFKVKNLDLVQSILQNTSQIYTNTITFPDGTTTNSSIAGDVQLNSVAVTGEHEGLTTMDAEFTYSGVVTFTPAT